MRKTFIEAYTTHDDAESYVEVFPLMRKTFIEACCAQLPRSMLIVSSAYAEDFH